MSRGRGPGLVIVIVGILIAGAALPVLGAERDSGTFEDDDGQPAERALEWLAEAGVLDGCNPPANTEICPDRDLTRAEAAKVLVLLGRHQDLLGPHRPGTLDHFVDDDMTWGGSAQPLIGHLADVGIVHGCNPPSDTRFCPDDPLLRGQVAKMLVGVLELKAPGSYVTPWTDTAGQFYHEAARIAAYRRIWDSSAGLFRGHQVVTRGEFARIAVAAVDPGLCDENPFTAARVRAVGSRHPGVATSAYVYDYGTGCAYWMNPDNRQQTASVFKVMVMGGVLADAQAEGRAPTSWEMSQMRPMITESSDPPVRNLWDAAGGSPWFRRQVERFGLTRSTAKGDDGQPWGRTLTSALDQADLLRQVVVGEWGPLDADNRAIVRDLMTSVVPSQTWGVTEGVPPGREVALKNGFAAGTTNSAGVVSDDAGAPDYVVVILTIGWPSWPQGVDTVEEISMWVAEAVSD